MTYHLLGKNSKAIIALESAMVHGAGSSWTDEARKILTELKSN